ncbi:MAG TPA: carbonic anhydrase [Nitrososphaeraceae archaeon]|nr:carbonic anhydrase [Nitrososphaeraceae archaeon]
MSFRFGTAINCIDGRTQEPVIEFMKHKYGIDGVDMVTFPGADGIISSSGNSDVKALIRNAVSISIEKHGSQIIAVIGHFDCAGNPGNKEHHYEHIDKAVVEVSSWGLGAEIVGLYVNDNRQIEQVK